LSSLNKIIYTKYTKPRTWNKTKVGEFPEWYILVNKRKERK